MDLEEMDKTDLHTSPSVNRLVAPPIKLCIMNHVEMQGKSRGYSRTTQQKTRI